MISQRSLGSILLLAGAAVATGCAPSIRSERDENIPVPQGATWAWSASAAPGRDTAAAGRYIPQRFASSDVDPIVQQRFRRAIEAAMTAKGFRKADDPAQADFLVAYAFDGTDAYRRPAVAPSLGFGYYGGWARPWGFGAPFGFYRPWGLYRPWGWGLGGWSWGWGLSFAYPAWGYAGAPYYGGGVRAYRDGWVSVTLRLRSDGEVAWIGRYRGEEHQLRDLPQAKVNELVSKVFATLH